MILQVLAERLIDRSGVRKCFRDIRIKQNYVRFLTVPFIILPLSSLTEIVRAVLLAQFIFFSHFHSNVFPDASSGEQILYAIRYLFRCAIPPETSEEPILHSNFISSLITRNRLDDRARFLSRSLRNCLQLIKKGERHA